MSKWCREINLYIIPTSPPAQGLSESPKYHDYDVLVVPPAPGRIRLAVFASLQAEAEARKLHLRTDSHSAAPPTAVIARTTVTATIHRLAGTGPSSGLRHNLFLLDPLDHGIALQRPGLGELQSGHTELIRRTLVGRGEIRGGNRIFAARIHGMPPCHGGRKLAAFEFSDHDIVVERQDIPDIARENTALRQNVPNVAGIHPPDVGTGLLGHGPLHQAAKR